MKRFSLFLLTGLLSSVLFGGQSIRLGTVVCNGNKTLTVPIHADGLENVASLHAVVTFDPLVLVLLKTERSEATHAFTQFSTIDDINGVEILAFTTNNIPDLSGAIANLTFAVREGSEGLYSDLALAEVEVNEKTMTADLTIGNPLVPKSGMVRSYATTASPTRLDEGVLTVAAGTILENLTLEAGDQLQASTDGMPIVITGRLTANGDLKILPPTSGWTTASYPVLKCKTAGLKLDVQGEYESAMVTETQDGAYTIYTVTTTVTEKWTVETAEGVTLSANDKNMLADLLGLDAKSGVSTVSVNVSQTAVEMALDLGIAPLTTEADGVLTARFELPKLKIVGFEPEKGIVRAKVIPPQGMKFASQQHVTGVIHVFGTSDLKTAMERLASPEINLDGYLKSETAGEMEIRVQFGTKTFFRVVAGRVVGETLEAPAKSSIK